MWPNPRIGDLVTFTEKILNGKLFFDNQPIMFTETTIVKLFVLEQWLGRHAIFLNQYVLLN